MGLGSEAGHQSRDGYRVAGRAIRGSIRRTLSGLGTYWSVAHMISWIEHASMIVATSKGMST
jgi:hypothetical protein